MAGAIQFTSNIAKWDGINWSPLGSGLSGVSNSNCSTIELDTLGNLYAGGSFTAAGGIRASFIAKWDGSSWTAIDSGMSSLCSTIAIDKLTNSLYAGGQFINAGNNNVNYVTSYSNDYVNLFVGSAFIIGKEQDFRKKSNSINIRRLEYE